MQNFTSVPFKTESGLSSVNGVAKFSSAGVVLEFESKLFGVIGGGVREVRLPLAEVLDIKFRKGFMRRGARIELRTKSFAKLSELPSKEGKLTLKLVPDDFDRAKAAVEQLQKELTQAADSLPPPRTPVSQLFDEAGDEETQDLS